MYILQGENWVGLCWAVIFEKTRNKNNKTRALLRAIDRLDLNTGEYTPLCYVPGHCFNGCGISPETNEIFCREKLLSVAAFDRISVSVGTFRAWENAFYDGKKIWRFFFQRIFTSLQWHGFTQATTDISFESKDLQD